MKTIFLTAMTIVLFSVFSLNAVAKNHNRPGSSAQKSNSATAESSAEQMEAPELDEATKQYLRNKRMRRTGGVLLGSGLGLAIAGAALVEIDAWGKIGKAGFTLLGTGLGVSVTGMFLLAFSKKVPLRTNQHTLSAVPASKGQGMSVVYSRSF